MKAVGGAAGITSLAGCADYLSGRQEERPGNTPEEDTPPENTKPTDEPDDPSDGTEDDETPEDDQEQASSYTWEDVREVDYEHIRTKGDTQLVDRMLSGEDVPGPFDLEEAQNTDISDYEEVKQLMEDTANSYWEHLAVADGIDDARSGYSHEAGHTTELVLEELFENRVEVISANDGHGFAYIKVEDHPLTIIDINVGAGRINSGHLNGTINGQSIPGSDVIANFEEWDQNSNAAFQGILNGLYGEIENAKLTGFESNLVTDIYQDLKQDADQVFSRIKPALAVATYERVTNAELYEDESYEDPAPAFIIQAESLQELPEFEEENIEEYREELIENHIDIVGLDEANERLYNQ